MRAIGILTDLAGPKLRMGRFEEGGASRGRGTRPRAARGGVAAAGEILFDFGGFQEAAAGAPIVLADGQAEIVVESVEPGTVLARTTRGGEIGDRKGVHFPIRS
jgi:pyruvate kinase